MLPLRALLLGLFALILASLGTAAPLRYQVDMVAPVDAPPEFRGATVALSIVWNSDLLSPVTDLGTDQRWSTSWRTTNTSATMTITGSTGRDGTYKDSTLPTIWAIHNNFPGIGDMVTFPRLDFPIGGATISIGGLDAVFANSYYQELSTLHPKPFASNEVTWQAPVFITSNPPTEGPATGVTGFAAYVPEPSALALSSVALFSLAALGRRK